MEWIGAKVDWIKKIKFFAHPYLGECNIDEEENASKLHVCFI